MTAQRVVPDDVVADLHLLPGLHQRALFLLESAAGEPEEHQDDRDVDDVAAVAALVAADETDQRGEHVGAGGLLADARAAPELLRDGAHDEAAEGEAEPRAPDTDAKRDRHVHRSRARTASGTGTSRAG